MKKFLGYSLFFVFIVIFTKILDNTGENPTTPFIKDIQSGYRGVIVEKYHLKTIHLKILTDKQEVIDIAMLSPDLKKKSNVGDSLIKIPNKNCCVLKNESKSIVLQYIFVPEKILEDKKWPEDMSPECLL